CASSNSIDCGKAADNGCNKGQCSHNWHNPEFGNLAGCKILLCPPIFGNPKCGRKNQTSQVSIAAAIMHELAHCCGVGDHRVGARPIPGVKPGTPGCYEGTNPAEDVVVRCLGVPAATRPY